MKTKEIYLKDVKQGDKVVSSFLAAEKSMAFSLKGSPYLNIRLKDKTGELDGKVWDNAVELDQQFKKGDIISIEGRAASYKNSIQISIVKIKKNESEDIDPADYLPAAKGNVDAMFNEILVYVANIQTKPLQDLLQSFFHDEKTAELFKRAPAAKGFHHIYLGGLLEHTLSVVRLLDKVSEHYPDLNKDMLITGGILHDIGKVYEFSYNSIIEYSDEGRLIGHIVMGVEMINKKIAVIPDFPGQLALELRHIILSHHGEFEFGSPKRPKTLEALVVHYIDDLDAKFNAFQTFIADSTNPDSDWTSYNRLLERYLYKKNSGEPKLFDH
ncbi:MAG: HD family phosphohydrolase [Deltaproteobacteria bacterium HGW-Deltaproteobacteria-13]|nr:MAG: HD family phosphohydrolase [Deltaproteobacteria bacterium HGW-Deltaproteobacteria-13]